MHLETLKCTRCALQNPISIHIVLLPGALERLCTACTLAVHPGHFCPICFDVFKQDVKADNNGQQQLDVAQSRVKCLRCPAVAHLTCTDGASDGYICPKCSDPSFRFFKFIRSYRGLVGFDEELRKQLVCASKVMTDYDGFCT